MLDIKEINWIINEKRLTNFFIKKPSQSFNLKNENAGLWAKIIQDKEESIWLKVKLRKLYAKTKDLMNSASIQSEKIEEKIV